MKHFTRLTNTEDTPSNRCPSNSHNHYITSRKMQSRCKAAAKKFVSFTKNDSPLFHSPTFYLYSLLLL